jgi:hypothetical protein
MTRLVGLELLKLRRRWLIWILLGLLVAGEALTIFGGYYLAVSGTMTFLDERGQILPIEMVLPNFILPGALRAVLGLTQQVGIWLLVILTAVVIGMEEAYGTLRQILERDQKLTPRIKPIQEHCNRTEIKKGFA